MERGPSTIRYGFDHVQGCMLRLLFLPQLWGCALCLVLSLVIGNIFTCRSTKKKR